MRHRLLIPLALVLASCTSDAPRSTATETRHATAPRTFFELRRTSETPSPGFHEVTAESGVLHVSDDTLLTNEDVASAGAVDDGSGSPKIELVFTPEGRRRFATATRDYVGQTLVLLIDQHVETMLAFDAEIDQPSVQIAKGGATTMEAAARFAARFDRARAASAAH